MSNDKLYEAYEQALELTKKTLDEVEGWQPMKGSNVFKGHNEHIYTWKKEVPGMTVPMWKAKTLLEKPPSHFGDVFVCKYLDCVQAEPVPMSEVGILHNLAPTVRVVYQRTKSGGVISSRDSVFVQGFSVEDEKLFFVDVGVPKALPKRKNTVRVQWFLISGVLYPSPETPNKTVLIYLAQKDLGGLLPRRLYNTSEAHRMFLPFFKTMESLVVTSQEKQKYYEEVEEVLKNPKLINKKFSFTLSSSSAENSSEEFSPKSSNKSSTSYSSSSSEEPESKNDTQLVKFLVSLDLGNYIETFQREEVSYKMLLAMDEKDLQDMGIPFGPRRAIAKAKKQKLQDVNTIENVEIKGNLGKGSFGEVFEGTWNGTTPIALKKLHQKSDMDNFLKEASLLQNMVHPNILRFYGIYNSAEGESYIVTELMPLGNLRDLLKKRGEEISVWELLQMAKDVAAGLMYMKSHKVIHRDLSARNLLVVEQEGRLSIKISDFGLSRSIENEYYTLTDASKYPIKWTAPEVYDTKKHSVESDIWSFGVVLWEMFSHGREPYDGMSNKEVVQKVKDGMRLECPDTCPAVVYEELVLPCWKEAQKRPSLQHIFKVLKDLDEAFSTDRRRRTSNSNEYLTSSEILNKQET